MNPAAERRGHGTSIVRHLIGEAAILVRQSRGYYDVLFLDVYTANESAISLYGKCGFTTLTDEPIPDTREDWQALHHHGQTGIRLLESADFVKTALPRGSTTPRLT